MAAAASTGMTPILLRGRLVALVGREHCHVIAPDLDAAERQTVLLMCLYVSQQVDEHDDTTALSTRAEVWARRVAPTLSTPR
jgi:hypothetical protein